MCGIFAVASLKEDVPLKGLNIALTSLSKRGPDDRGILTFPHCVLGQTRLSIIDLSGGHQPMRDNTYPLAITFNGEIYNYKEIKKELEKKGHAFSTNSDTEVILKAHKEYGVDCLKHLDGMFAFAIWDEGKKSLFIARDRFGKKPLYYAFDKLGNLMIASEIKALFASGLIKGEIDPEAIDNYLALMYIPPWRTIYKNVFTLAPAEYALYRNGKLEKKKYWELEFNPISIEYNEAKEEIKRLFTEAVKKRMVADVEIGSFLSGGVDSTLVTMYAQEYTTHPLKTFSLGYGNYRNELPYAETASTKIGTDHHTLQANEDLTHVLKESLAYFDEPHADSSDFPQSLLSQFAAQKVKVALSGDGADELFMGYGWYNKHMNLSWKAHTFEKMFLNPFEGYVRNISIFSPSERKRLWGQNTYVKEFLNSSVGRESLNSIEKINIYDLTTYLPGQLLTKIDRMSMMHSLEVRSPFLDHTLAQFVYNLPIKYKMNRSENKIILKDILAESMPKEFVYRKKQGFGAPVEEWLNTPRLKGLVLEKLGDKASIYSILRKEEVQNIVSSFYSKGKKLLYYKVWVLLCLELWLESHIADISS
ncbi:MAG: asparagine synthase (glutamine-hydrolyzing) [Patescibacteria group bacterium]|nr:asparagine synthase (glutamine-hydrolyzing) [bacterium]MDZ4240712.1 asparagine synthase (glutamine-hydrolyzing) [Patescibacteria group bacterium]